jgi:hypothetical protein
MINKPYSDSNEEKSKNKLVTIFLFSLIAMGIVARRLRRVKNLFLSDTPLL